MKSNVYLIHNAIGFGGGTKSLLEIAEILIQNYNVKLLLNKNSHDIQKHAKNLNIEFELTDYKIPQFPIFSGGKSFFSLSFLKSIFSLILNYNNFKKIFSYLDSSSIFILNSITLLPIVFFLPKNKKIIVINRETLLNKLQYFFYSIFLQKYINLIFFISLKELDSFKNLSISKAFLPDFYNYKLINIINKNTKTSSYDIIFLGGDNYIKGLDILLKALIFGKLYNLRIAIFGFSNRKYSFSFFKPWKWKDYLFLKFINDNLSKFNFINIFSYSNQVENYIFNSEILVFSSRYPHQSRPFIEAGILKTPVIISNFKKTNDIYINEFNCLTFNPKSYKDLANQINKLLSDHSLRNRVISNNYIFNLNRSKIDYYSTFLIKKINEL